MSRDEKFLGPEFETNSRGKYPYFWR